MDQSIHVGAVAPYQYILTVESKGEFDLSLVTEQCVLEVLDEDKSEEDPDAIRTWTATPSEAAVTQGGSMVVLTHTYQLGDVPKIGTLYIRARISHPNGTIFTGPSKLMVVSSFAG